MRSSKSWKLTELLFAVAIQVLESTPRHVGGIHSENAAVNLILADQPHRTYVKNVEGFEHHVDRKVDPPAWNRFPRKTGSLEWYSNLFLFADQYLDDDGGLVVFMLHGLMYELHRNAIRRGYTIAREWICHQPVPLQHVLFQNMKVLDLHSDVVFPSIYSLYFY